MQKLYVGRRDRDTAPIVRVIGTDGDTRALPLRHDLAAHAESFEWGYDGSGPAQLALALLADALETADYSALRYYQQFKHMCVAQMPREAWSMTANTVCRYAVVIAIGESTHASTAD